MEDDELLILVTDDTDFNEISDKELLVVLPNEILFILVFEFKIKF
jgi:hypothetical protein